MKTCLPFIHLSLHQIAHRTSAERDINESCQAEEDVNADVQLASLQGENDDFFDSNATNSTDDAGITDTLAEGDMPSSPKINVATIDHHKDKVFALAVAGDLLYSASQSKDIRVFRVHSLEEVDCFGSGNGMVQSLMAFGDKLYSAHQDNKIRVWRRVMRTSISGCILKHKLVAVLPRLDHFVKSMLLDRKYVQVRRHKRKLWIQHVDTISALALGSSGSGTRGEGGDKWQKPPSTVLYSASWDKTVKVWSLSNFKCVESFSAHNDAINAMIVIDGIVLATASADGSIKLWTRLSHSSSRRKKHSLINTLHGHKAAVNSLALSANMKILYSGGSDGAIIAWKKVYSKPARAARLSRQTSSTLSSTISEIKGMLQRKRSTNGRFSGEEYSNEEILSLIGGLGEKGVINEGGLSREGVVLGRTTSNVCKQCGSEISCTSCSAAECSSSKYEDACLRQLRSMRSGEMNSEKEDQVGVTAGQHGSSGLKAAAGVDYQLIRSSSSSRSGGPVSNMNFVMRKVIVGHARAVLSVSTVGDDIVCSSSADKTIRVWQLRVSSRPAGGRPDNNNDRATSATLPRSHSRSSSVNTIWDYECLAVLAGHGGPVKSIASICPNANHIIPSRSVIRQKLYTAHDQELHRADDDDESASWRNGCTVIYSAGLDSKVKVWVLPTSS